MPATPVRRLTIAHPDLSSSVSVSLPWDSFPAAMQNELDALDVDDDGAITYTPRVGGNTSSLSVESHHANRTSERLQRVLWGYAWSYPSNRYVQDDARLPDRMTNIQTVQQRLYNDVVLALLGNGNDLTKWEPAQRVLEMSGDYTHLYRLAEQAIGKYNRGRNIEYLRRAESLLLAARRYAARVRSGRRNTAANSVDLADIDQSLGRITGPLDRYETAAFRRDVQRPYLMATMGSPMTANVSGGEVYYAVAVPQSFIDANSGDVETAIKNYFNNTEQVSIRASRFQDSSGSQAHRLSAIRVERDAPGPHDDRINSQSSFHLYQPRLNRTVFRGHDVVYYRVGFQLADKSEALDGQHIRRFDLELQHDGNTRRIPGGFVLQNMAGRSSHDVFASDLHVNDRDYTVVRDMMRNINLTVARWNAQGLTHTRKYRELLTAAAQVERFYEPINEQIEAAVDEWNAAYRSGEIHHVFLLGDLADFVNVAVTLDRVGYRSSNIRTLKAILSRLEAPLYVVSGNHDHHGAPFPYSLHRRNFVFNGHLQDLYEDHYDDQHFEGLLYLRGVEALFPGTNGAGGSLIQILRRLTASDPFGVANDDNMGHHLRELGMYETYASSLGNGFRVFLWPTESEHFNYSRFLLEEVHEPVGPNMLRAVKTYVGDQHPSGKGPRPENFISFIRELEAAKRAGERMILGGHYPPFSVGMGPDQTPDSADAMRGDATWAIRMASWYYRMPGGHPVLALAMSGHVHRYEESDFTFDFGKLVDHAHAGEDLSDTRRAELIRNTESEFRRRLGAIFRSRNTNTIFDQLHTLRHEFHLDDISRIRRVYEPGSDGVPGPIVGRLNAACLAYGRENGTAFVNIPSIGVPADSRTGYTVVTTHPDSTVDVNTRFMRVRYDNRIVSADGRRLENYRRTWWRESRDWDPTRSVGTIPARTRRTRYQVYGPHTVNEDSRWDLFPLVYQYPRRKIGLALDAGMSWNFRNGEVGALLGGQLLFPLSHHANATLGGPNYITIGGYWNSATDDLMVNAGINFGLITPLFFVDEATSGNPFFGGEARFTSVLPLPPQIGIWGGSDIQGNWGVGLNLIFSIPSLTYRLGDGHSHSYTQGSLSPTSQAIPSGHPMGCF